MARSFILLKNSLLSLPAKEFFKNRSAFGEVTSISRPTNDARLCMRLMHADVVALSR